MSRRKDPNRKKTKRRWKTWVLAFTFFALIAATLAIGVFLWQLNRVFNPDHAIPGNEGNNPGSVSAAESEPKKADPFSILLLGKDSRPETGSLNTDVIMVAVVQPKEKKVYLLSVPRDTKIQMPGYSGNYKANAVFAYGEAHRRQAERNHKPITETGISLARETFGEYLGIPINYYVTVDFDGFTSLVDALGGVEVDVDRTLIYDDPSDNTHIYLKKGLQVLDGNQALGYVRHRLDNRGSNYASSDFDRNRRQRQVLQAAVDKLKSFEGFTSFFELMDVAGNHVRTDIPISQMKNMISEFHDMAKSDLIVLENEAFWDSSSGFTLIPKERLVSIRSLLKEILEIQP